MARIPGLHLLIDTAAPTALVGVVRDDAVVAAHMLAHVRQHAEALPGAIETVLERAGAALTDLDSIVVGRGPGSFVGVRVGMAHAKGMCTALGIPLYTVSTLSSCVPVSDVAGEGAPADGERVVIALDARRHEVYTLAHTWTGTAWRPDPAVTALHPADMLAACQPGDVVHTNHIALLGGVEPARGGRPACGPLEAPAGVTVVKTAGASAAGMWAALCASAQGAPDAADTQRPHGAPADRRVQATPEYVRAPDAKLPGGITPPAALLG